MVLAFYAGMLRSSSDTMIMIMVNPSHCRGLVHGGGEIVCPLPCHALLPIVVGRQCKSTPVGVNHRGSN